MELIEIIRWISIVLMWAATGLNVCALIRSLRLDKKQMALLKQTDEVYREYMTLRDKYIELLEKRRMEDSYAEESNHRTE